MIEVSKQDYHKFLRFAENSTCNRVYPLSIAEGIQNGQIFVDSQDNPKGVLFWHHCGFAYLSGEPSERFLTEVMALIRNHNRNQSRRFVLQVENKEWDEYFTNQSGITRGDRYHFGFRETEFLNEEIELPDGFAMQEIDELLLPKISGKIIPSFSWDVERDFLEKGKGFCIRHGDDIAATVFTSAVSHDEIDIGIETNENYRKCGLASILAKRMIQYILEEQKTPVWECNIENIGSRSVAEKVGFYRKGIHFFFSK